MKQAALRPSGRLKVWGLTSRRQLNQEPTETTISILEDPAIHASAGLALTGAFSVQSADGEPYPGRERMTLCRCGHSSNKPFCDGSHAASHWQDGL